MIENVDQVFAFLKHALGCHAHTKPSDQVIANSAKWLKAKTELQREQAISEDPLVETTLQNLSASIDRLTEQSLGRSTARKRALSLGATPSPPKRSKTELTPEQRVHSQNITLSPKHQRDPQRNMSRIQFLQDTRQLLLKKS